MLTSSAARVKVEQSGSGTDAAAAGRVLEGVGRWRARPLLLAAAGVVLLAFLTHLPSLPGDFVYDDLKVFLADPNLSSWETLPRVFVSPTLFITGTASIYRPVSSLSWGLELLTWARVGGAVSPFPFHLTNLVLHALTAVLLLLVIDPLIGRERAVVAAALFAVHPATVEDIGWIVGRADVLALLFSLAAILALRLRSGLGRAVAAPALTLLAWGAKEVSFALLPVMLLLLVAEPSSRRRRLVPAVALAFAVSAGFLVVHRVVVGSGASFPSLFPQASPLDRVHLALTVLAVYARILVWPHPLTVEYFWVGSAVPPLLWLGGLALVVASIVAAVVRRWRRVGVWMALVLLPLAPVVHLFPFFELIAERYLYFSAAAFCVLVAMALSVLGRRSPVLQRAALTVVLVVWSALTLNQSAVWLDAVTLFEHAQRYAPESPVVHNNLATAYLERGQPEKALPHWEKLVRIAPSNRLARFNLARWRLAEGRAREALEALGSRGDWQGDVGALALWDEAARRAVD